MIYFKINDSSKLYALSLANKILCDKQLKTLDRFVNSAPQVPFSYNNVAMVNNSVYTNELNILNANIITTINKLKNQNKRADIDSIQKQLVKTTSMQDLTKEDLLKKVHDLKTEGKIVNKLNRNKDSFHVSKDIVDAFSENIIEKTPIIFHDSFFETPKVNQTDSQSFSNSFSRESRSSSITDFDIIINAPAVAYWL